MDLYADIAETADALTSPRHHAEPRWEWDHNRHRKALPSHKTVVPSLIEQLRQQAEPASGGDDTGIHTVPESRPPGDFNASSLLASITYGVLRRLTDPPPRNGKPFGGLGMDARATPEENINAIVGGLSRCDHATLLEIRAEFRSWRWQAEVITKWREPAVQLVAPCPVVDTDGEGTPCGARGSLLAQPDGKAARCTACGAQWDDNPGTGNIRILFQQVLQYRLESKAAADKARAEDRQRKLRMAGKLAA